MLKHPVQLAIAIAFLALAAVFAMGASQLPSDGGYAGVGSSFVPWVVSAFLGVIGLLLAYQAVTTGFRSLDAGDAIGSADRRGALWVSAGILLMAALITRIGFVPAATILFVCAARGFGSVRPVRDIAIGAFISFPVFWLFTLVLDVNLPRLINDWL
ncbi:MAG: tripartite tricarboxylate transporter TctB family protein [Betaproteobacteria bacterium]|nr:MAG: tripartite tricarboxylate transporter TctB family protein [Betaproteobacteria bacterium]